MCKNQDMTIFSYPQVTQQVQNKYIFSSFCRQLSTYLAKASHKVFFVETQVPFLMHMGRDCLDFSKQQHFEAFSFAFIFKRYKTRCTSRHYKTSWDI